MEDKWNGSGGPGFSTPEVVLDFDGEPDDDGIKPDDSYDPNNLSDSDAFPSPLVGSHSSPMTPSGDQGRNLFFTPSERQKTIESQVTDQMAAFTLSSSGPRSPTLPTSSPRSNVTPPPQETYASPLSGSNEAISSSPSNQSATTKLKSFISAPRSSTSWPSPSKLDRVTSPLSAPLGPQGGGDGVTDDDTGL